MSYLMLIKGSEKQIINETEYKQEQKLRDMVEEHPCLISLPGVEEGDVLLPIAKEHKASDLICVDNQGNIIVLEFKLDRNQTMRDIVAQILDYASTIWKESYEEFNGSVREYLKKNYGKEDIATVFFEKFQDEIDLAKFDGDENRWKEDFAGNIVANLNRGIFKLVILANKIPGDVKRVTEYLYSVHSMDVHCIEVDYFRRDDIEILVPKHFDFGKRQAPSSGQRRSWDYDSFIEDATRKCDATTLKTIESLYDFANDNGEVSWGTGYQMGSASFKVDFRDKKVSLFNLFSHGVVQVGIGWLSGSKADESLIKEFIKKINEIEGVQIPLALNKWPNFKASVLNDERKFDQFTKALLWMKERLK